MDTGSLVQQAAAFERHAHEQQCRFDAEQKAAEAVAFVLQSGGASFAVPSKLEGTSKTQRQVRQLRRFEPLRLRLAEGGGSDTGRQIDATNDDGEAVGRLRPKHYRWVQPLLAHGIRCHVLQVTGQGQRYRGCNIVLTNVATAIHRHRSAQAQRYAIRTMLRPAINAVAELPTAYA